MIGNQSFYVLVLCVSFSHRWPTDRLPESKVIPTPKQPICGPSRKVQHYDWRWWNVLDLGWMMKYSRVQNNRFETYCQILIKYIDLKPIVKMVLNMDPNNADIIV